MNIKKTRKELYPKSKANLDKIFKEISKIEYGGEAREVVDALFYREFELGRFSAKHPEKYYNLEKPRKINVKN